MLFIYSNLGVTQMPRKLCLELGKQKRVASSRKLVLAGLVKGEPSGALFINGTHFGVLYFSYHSFSK